MKTLTTIIILLISVYLFAWDYPHERFDFVWDFHEEQPDWTVVADCRTELTRFGLEFHELTDKTGYQCGYYQLLSFRFHPQHFKPDRESYTNYQGQSYFIAEEDWTGAHKLNFYYEISFFSQPEIMINEIDEPEERFIVDERKTYNDISEKSDEGEILGEIRVFVDLEYVDPDREFYFYMKEINAPRNQAS